MAGERQLILVTGATGLVGGELVRRLSDRGFRVRALVRNAGTSNAAKANTASGRVPDENYAREVMQLFSIGLVELNEDGSAKAASGTQRGSDTPLAA